MKQPQLPIPEIMEIVSKVINYLFIIADCSQSTLSLPAAFKEFFKSAHEDFFVKVTSLPAQNDSPTMYMIDFLILSHFTGDYDYRIFFNINCNDIFLYGGYDSIAFKV